MSIPSGGLGSGVTVLGVIGFVAKGVALVVVGILLTVAAIKVDPGSAGGLDGAIRALLDVFAGPFLVAVVGAGFIAYGAFCFFRARYARL
jgi:type IV secretory pathway VirB2 component (pilin)